jgi:hypothetical protein
VIPHGFPENPVRGQEIHTEILSLKLVGPDGNTVKAGQPFYDSVVGTPQERLYQSSFREVQGLDNDFPGDSFFNEAEKGQAQYCSAQHLLCNEAPSEGSRRTGRNRATLYLRMAHS